MLDREETQTVQSSEQGVHKYDFTYSEITSLTDLEYAVYKKRALYEENEEATKQGLIIPLLQLMDYDPRNVHEVYPEYTVPENGKADYLLRVGSEFKHVVEAKSLGKKLIRHIPQLKKYFDPLHDATLGILTDGNHYLFFTDLETTGEMDSEPFLVISQISHFRSERVKTLWELYRVTRFDAEYVEEKIVEGDGAYIAAYQKAMDACKSLKLTEKEKRGLIYLLGNPMKETLARATTTATA